MPKINFTEFIDIEFLQKFQDYFSKTMGVASIAVDDSGPITKPSNFTDFCIKYTRGTKEGYSRCNDCDIKWGVLAAKEGKPMIYTCHTGLTDFAVPIMIGDQHIASILGGQVLTEPPNEEHFRELARELGINEDEYVKALKKIKIVPIETIESAANFLYLVANAISKISHMNFELQNRNEMKELYMEITDAIRGSLDIKTTKQKIVNVIGKTLEADRCFILEYDKNNDTILKIEDEYLSSDTITSFKGLDINSLVPRFVTKIKKGEKIIVNNQEIETKGILDSFESEKLMLIKYKIKSSLGYPLFYAGEFLGAIVIHYTEKEHKIDDDKVTLMEMLANQISMAIYQAKTHELTKKQAERERLLRTMFENIRSSLDINVIKDNLVTELGKSLKADRCFISTYIPEDDAFIIDFEYRSSSNVKSVVNTDSRNLDAKLFIGAFKNKEEINYANVEEFIIKNNLTGSAEEEFRNEYSIKSSHSLPILYANCFLGTINLQYTENYIELDESDIELIRIIATQAGIAIYQANLFKRTKMQEAREKFSKNIIEILRESLDKNMIKHLFIKNIGQHFKANRVFFSDFDPINSRYIPIDENSEYLSSNNEKSFVNVNWADDALKLYIMPLTEKRELNIVNWNEYIQKIEKSEGFLSFFEGANIKSSYNFPVIYQGRIMGYFCIEFTEKITKLSDEDIKIIRNICTQAGIALYHSELYQRGQESTKSKAEFIRDMSKELDIPLNMITGFSEILSKTELEHDKQLECLDNIGESAKQIADLTNYITTKFRDSN